MESIDNTRQQGIAVFKSVLDNKSTVTSKQIINQLKEGNANPAYVIYILKKFAKIQEDVWKDKDVKELAIEEVKKYLEGNVKTAELFGADITVTSGNYWDYTHVNDPYLQELERIETEIKERIKARKEEIQAKATTFHNRRPEDIISIGNDFEMYVEEMPNLTFEKIQEIYVINPPVQRGKESLRFSKI